jgi:hypothetical protein
VAQPDRSGLSRKTGSVIRPSEGGLTGAMLLRLERIRKCDTDTHCDGCAIDHSDTRLSWASDDRLLVSAGLCPAVGQTTLDPSGFGHASAHVVLGAFDSRGYR